MNYCPNTLPANQIKTVEVHLSPADILGWPTTPTLVIPGEPGKIHDVIAVAWSFYVGAIHYTGGSNVTLSEETTGATLTTSGAGPTSALINGATNFVKTTGSFSSPPTRLVGAGVTVTSAVPYADGNGTMKVVITYITVNV